MKKNLIFILAVLLSCSRQSNTEDFILKHKHNNIVFSNTKHYISKQLVIPKGKTLHIKAGAQIFLGPKAEIIINGRIIAKGTQKYPILFSLSPKAPSDTPWRMIQINNSFSLDTTSNHWLHPTKIFSSINAQLLENLDNINILSHCVFEYAGVNNFKKKNNHKAVIEANHAIVLLKNNMFRHIHHIGAIQLKNSSGIIHNNFFQSCGIHKTIHVWNSIAHIHQNEMITSSFAKKCHDGIWSIKAKVLITNNTITGKGDDGIDIENSLAYIYSNKIKANKDDGIDIDLNSNAIIIKNRIDESGDNGLLVSNNSRAILIHNYFGGRNKQQVTLRNGGYILSKNNSFPRNTRHYYSKISWPEIIKAHKENYERLLTNLKFISSNNNRMLLDDLSIVIKKLKNIRKAVQDNIFTATLSKSLSTPHCNIIQFANKTTKDTDQIKQLSNIFLYNPNLSFMNMQNCAAPHPFNNSLLSRSSFEENIRNISNSIIQNTKKHMNQE